MKRCTPTGVLLGLVLACLAAAGTAQAAEKEKAWELLDGLRQRYYYDSALDYLEQMRTSDRCPDDLKEVIDYEAGVTLMTGSRREGTLQARESQLDEARSRFEKFIKEKAAHPMASTANTQLANLLVERGRIKVEIGSQANKSEAEKTKLKGEARVLFQQAHTAFEEAERRVYERAKSLQGVLDPKKDAEKIEARDQARRELLQARLFLAGVVYEIGKTYPQGSEEYKQNLAKAAQQYNKLFQDYGSLIGGLYARMWEGRAYKDLGQTDQAVSVMKEMLTLPDAPEAFRLLKNQSLILLLETYMLPKVKKRAEAVALVDAWGDDARGGEESSTEGLAIHYLGGLASLEYAQSLKPNDAKRKGNLTAARRHFDFVARFPGEHQRDARTRLLSLSADPNEKVSEPTNYVEAKDKADFAWGTMVVALGQTQNAASEEARQKATRQMSDSRDDAIHYYRLALTLKTDDDEVSTDEVNLVRFRLTYLYWAAQDFYRSAVMGEFLATRYPQSAGARKGGEIAVKAYRNLFSEARNLSLDTTFETKQMEALANYITTRWKDEPEAQEAWMMLIDTAIDNGDLEGAIAYLEKIAPDSPQRAQAELRAGRALWAAYVSGSGKDEAERPSQEELDEMVQKAQQTLADGINRMREEVDAGGRPSYSLVYSVFSLALIHIDAGQSKEAVAWLDDPKIGPMTLLKADDPSVRSKDQFAEDTYKAALRAYVGEQMLDEAEAVMAALEELVAAGGDAEANKRLTKIYIHLGRELQEQLTRLRTENKTEELKRVSQGFEMFLKKISEREEGNNFTSLYWVAETFFGLGAGMDPGGKEPPDEAKVYYRNAADTYIKILKRIAADPEFAPTDADISVKVRLAACLRALGSNEQALKLLVAILLKREKRLDVQIEATRTYQDWGEDRSGYYVYAIRGGQELDGRYLVWGWGGIANRVAPHYEKYKAIFHEARYNLALCRLKLALSKSGTEKTNFLKMAKLDVTRVHQQYPTMGGPEWYEKYDSLLKTVQKLLKEKPTGLKGEVPAAPSAPAAAGSTASSP